MGFRLNVAATKLADSSAQTSVRRSDAIDRNTAVAATQAAICRASIELDRSTNCCTAFSDRERAAAVSRLLLVAAVQDHTTAGVDARVSANCHHLKLSEHWHLL